VVLKKAVISTPAGRTILQKRKTIQAQTILGVHRKLASTQKLAVYGDRAARNRRKEVLWKLREVMMNSMLQKWRKRPWS